jgi:hypothetical protein
MEFSLSAAAKAVNRSKSSVHHALKTGKLSARRLEDGTYRIDASELSRVFEWTPSTGTEPSRPDDSERPTGPASTELAVLRMRVVMLQDQLTHERELYREVREELTAEKEERRSLQRQLTPPAPPKTMKGFLGRFLGR